MLARKIIVALCGCLLAMLASRVAVAGSYTYIDLGDFGGFPPDITAVAINDADQVVGSVGNPSQGLFWDPSGSVLGTLIVVPIQGTDSVL